MDSPAHRSSADLAALGDFNAIRVELAPPQFNAWGELLALLQASFGYMEQRIDPPSSLNAMTVDDLRAKAERESLILAWERGALVGCVYADTRVDCVYIGKLAVAQHARGRGIARRLITAAECIARAQHRDTLELQTRVELTDNHRTFAALGFVETLRTSHAGYTRPTSLTMRKRIARQSAPTQGS